jgi:hypothetical protein
MTTALGASPPVTSMSTRPRCPRPIELPVRPRSIGNLQVWWTLRLDGDEYHQVTGFLRDDDAR